MSTVIVPLRFSRWLWTWLALVHVGALACLVPIPMPLSWRILLTLAILLSFLYYAQRQSYLKTFDHLEWRPEQHAWVLSNHQRSQELLVTLRPGAWVTEHFLWLAFESPQRPKFISVWFGWDQYSGDELKQLRRAILQQHFLQ